MKYLVLFVLLALLLTGCVSEETPADTSSATAESVSAESSAPPAESTTEESKPESWTESVTKGNTTTTTEYRNGGKDYTATTEKVDDTGALTYKRVKEYKNSVLVCDTITEYLSTGEAYYDCTTYFDESGEAVRSVSMVRGQTYIFYRESTDTENDCYEATCRYESLDGVLLAEGTGRAYIDAGVRYNETKISVYDETGVCDHREKHVYATDLSYSLWEYSDADGNVIFAKTKTDNAEEVARTGENGGIISVQGTEYSFADINGAVFAKATMENNHFSIYEVYDMSIDEAVQRAQALLEYVLSFDKPFFLQTINYA